MYSIRVNSETKELVEEVANMVGLSVSSIFRKVRIKMERKKLVPINRNTVAVTHRDGKVINIRVRVFYHNILDAWMTADIEPISRYQTRDFRSCLIAACLDTKQASIEHFKRIQALEEQRKSYESMVIRERQALLNEVY